VDGAPQFELIETLDGQLRPDRSISSVVFEPRAQEHPAHGALHRDVGDGHRHSWEPAGPSKFGASFRYRRVSFSQVEVSLNMRNNHVLIKTQLELLDIF
jgi:hypothetical protein